MYTKLSLRPQMKISPQLVITGKVLQVPASELEQFIEREVAYNPALEFVSKSEYIKANYQSVRSAAQLGSHPKGFARGGPAANSSFEGIVENIAQYQSPLEKLTEQILLTAEKTDHETAISLLHRLDHRGFLVTPLEQLACELEVSPEMIKRAVQILHQLEPPGIGARDLRECFLIQCTHLEAEGMNCQHVRRILTVAWDEFLTQKWDRVAKKIKESRSVVEKACEFMRLNFDPHPLAILTISGEIEAGLNYADLIVLPDYHTNPPAYLLEIPGEEEFELRVATSFQKMLGPGDQGGLCLSAQEKTWIGQHLDRAGMLMGALRQRWETLRRIGEYLIEHQIDFIRNGPLYLKPLTRAGVARQLDLHESTVSRAVSNKIVQLPNGRLIPLDDFFDSSLAVKEAIRLLLRDNTKAWCDREIVEDLRSRGIHLSRRTVTKYRYQIKMTSSRGQLAGG